MSVMSVVEFKALLRKVLTFNSTQLDNISLLGEQLEGNLVSSVLWTVETDLSRDRTEVEGFVQDLVSVPERTINLVGAEQSLLPDWLYPPQYCRLLLRNLARCLSSSPGQSSGLSSLLYQALYCSYRDHVLSCQHWWRYLVTFPHQARPAMAQLDTNTRLRAVITTLRHSTNPSTLKQMFSDSISQSQVVEILLVRGLTWLGPEQVWCLVSYLAHSDRQQELADCLVRLVSVWSDQVEVEQGELHYLTVLSWTVCSVLGSLTTSQVDRVKERCLRRLTAGLTHWLEADQARRQLGLCAASVILQEIAGSVPDWTIEDVPRLEQMKSLASRDRTVREVEYEVELDRWDEPSPVPPSTNKISTNKTEPDKPRVLELDSDDSETDSDDDLPAYDMSDDKPWDKDQKPILYVRDVLEHLSDPDSKQHEECLQKMVEFSTTRLRHEDPAVVREVVSLSLHLQNKSDSPDWNMLRQTALTSTLVCRPTVCTPSLVERLFDREVTLDTKFTVLESLVGAGSRLREENSGEFGEFLTLTVAGLCGAGGGWARVKVRGLETSLVTQVVLGLARLVRLGENSPVLPHTLQHFTELLLTVAGSHCRTAVQAAVLHGLAVVATLVPPYLLRENLGDLLARGAEWAARLRGDLAQSGEDTAELLRLRHREGLRLEMEKELSQATEIKMKIDKHQVRLK